MSVASVELLRAAASGDLKRLREILVQGADINGTTKANQTALMLAAAFKRIEIVEYLVLAGADVNVQDELGLSASDWVPESGRTADPAASAQNQRGDRRPAHPCCRTSAAAPVPAE